MEVNRTKLSTLLRCVRIEIALANKESSSTRTWHPWGVQLEIQQQEQQQNKIKLNQTNQIEIKKRTRTRRGGGGRRRREEEGKRSLLPVTRGHIRRLATETEFEESLNHSATSIAGRICGT